MPPGGMCPQAGPPYELNPHTLETVAGGPATLGGLLIDGKAPSSTSSWILDTVGWPAQALLYPLSKHAQALGALV